MIVNVDPSPICFDFLEPEFLKPSARYVLQKSQKFKKFFAKFTLWLFNSHGKSPFLIGKPSINGPSIPWLC